MDIKLTKEQFEKYILGKKIVDLEPREVEDYLMKQSQLITMLQQQNMRLEEENTELKERIKKSLEYREQYDYDMMAEILKGENNE